MRINNSTSVVEFPPGIHATPEEAAATVAASEDAAAKPSLVVPTSVSFQATASPF
jgi:hypothetical protein